MTELLKCLFLMGFGYFLGMALFEYATSPRFKNEEKKEAELQSRQEACGACYRRSPALRVYIELKNKELEATMGLGYREDSKEKKQQGIIWEFLLQEMVNDAGFDGDSNNGKI